MEIKRSPRVMARVSPMGRITLPKGVMEALDLQPGNGVMILLRRGSRGARVILAGDKEILARGRQARRDFAEGRTRSLREYAQERAQHA